MTKIFFEIMKVKPNAKWTRYNVQYVGIFYVIVSVFLLLFVPKSCQKSAKAFDKGWR